jgi:MFS transporter, AAHS family, benzoate transport protein
VGSTRYLGRTTSGTLVAAFCCLIVAFDGYDISVYGTTVPTMLKYAPWSATASELGLVGSLTLIGMLFGSLLCGFATDRLGRKLMLTVSTAWFSACMIVCSLAPSLAMFGVFRLLAGIGLGGVLPTVIAFAVEFAPTGRRNLINAITNIGFPIGTIAAALVGIAVIEKWGFRPMYALAGLPLLVLPVAWLVLPESADYLQSKGRAEQAAEITARYRLQTPELSSGETKAPNTVTRLRTLLSRDILPSLVLFGAAGILVNLVIYGLNTWLPQLMREAGYPPASALTLLATLSAGAVAGGLVLSTLADRFGPRPITVLAFLIGAIALAILSSEPPTALVYVAVALAGAGSNGTANILYGFVAIWFPSFLRASALGAFITLARIGGILAPITGGWIISAGLAARWNFVALLVPAILGVVVALALPRRPSPGGQGVTDVPVLEARPATGT